MLSNLPSPDPIAAAHSEKLRVLICDKIAKQGAITFADFMQLALYAPGLGYYSAGSRKFGKDGDFVTAPEISPLFAYCLAEQCQQVLTELNGGDILELGAGSGIMAADLLTKLAEQNCLPKNYYILEISADLRERQQILLKNKIPNLFSRVKWLDHLPEKNWQGIILANEVIDAMPVHKFKVTNEISEFYVNCDKEKNFIWELQPPHSLQLTKQISALGIEQTSGYESEINPALPSWLTSLSAKLELGLILLIDYGFPRHEYYHPDRNKGTLMCHYRHRAHTDPLLLPGLQDITSHVDFTAIAEAGELAGLTIAGYTIQASFLLSCGLMNMAEKSSASIAEQLAISQQIKKLTLPSEMGELFKVIALTKELDIPLLGFSLYDMRGRL